MKLFKTTEWLISKLDEQKRISKELEAQRNTWIRRAVAMAGPDDIAQWARDGAGPWDINFSGRKS